MEVQRSFPYTVPRACHLLVWASLRVGWCARHAHAELLCSMCVCRCALCVCVCCWIQKLWASTANISAFLVLSMQAGYQNLPAQLPGRFTASANLPARKNTSCPILSKKHPGIPDFFHRQFFFCQDCLRSCFWSIKKKDLDHFRFRSSPA